MMKKTGKLLSLLLTVCMIAGMFPATAFAADTHKVAIHMQQYGMGTTDAQGVVSNKYYLVESDGSLNPDGAGENNYNIYYDEGSARLTINNLQISSNKSLLVPGGTTIEVLGTNRIEKAAESFGGGIGIVSDGDLTITGNGSLYLSSESYSGISWVTQNNDYDGGALTGNLQITGDVKLTIDHMGATTCINTRGGDVVIGGNAEVHLDPRKGNDNTFSIAFFNGGSITVQDSAKVFSTAAIDTFGTNSSGEYGRIDLLGSSVLTFEVKNEAIGRAMHASGGIEVAEGVKVSVSSNTKNGQVIASNAGNIKIAGEVEVNMLNQSSETSVALYAQNIEVTGKLTVNGGIYAMYVPDGNQVTFDGADVKVTSAVGVWQKAQITNSLIEMNTTMRAFAVIPDVSLTNEYAVYAGKNADGAVFIPHTNGAVAPESWINPYVRIGSHTCTYDRQVAADQYLVSASDCDSPASYYYSCMCGAKGTETFTVGTPSGHDWGEPVWNWSEDGKTAAVTFTCQNDNTHTQSPDVYITSAVKTPATCTEKGTTTYTAKVTFEGKEYTSIKDVEDIAPKDHDWGEPVWNWSEDGKTAAVTFTCQNDNTHTQSPDVDITSAVKTPATCTEKGTTTYTAKVTFEGKEYTSIKDVVDIAKLGHTLKKTDKVEATCTADGKEAYYTCEDCQKHFSDEEGKNEITKLGEYGIIPASKHKAEAEWKHNETSHWNECTNNCGEELNKESHTFKWIVDKKATEKEKGSKHEECSICGYKKASVEIPAVTPSDPEILNTDKPNNGKGSVETGDQTNVGLFISLISMSVLSVVILMVRKKRVK